MSEFRVQFLDGTWSTWRRTGIDHWRYEEAHRRRLNGEYRAVEAREDKGLNYNALV